MKTRRLEHIMNSKEHFEKARTEISNFHYKLAEVFCDVFMEDSNNGYEIAKSIKHAFDKCESERDYEIASDMLMAVCGYNIESLVEQIEKLDQSNYVWEIC